MAWSTAGARRAFAGAITAAALAVIAGGPAGATGRGQARALDALYERSLESTQDLTTAVGAAVAQLNAGGDAQSLDCLETLRDAASETTGQLLDVRDVADLSATLMAKADRRLGTAAVHRAASRALAVLPAEAAQVSQTAQLCAGQAAVQAKANSELQLIGETTSALGRIR
ncbi:MAG TPA: hypothetical protein VN806_12855 [Caulobacteraceae bacterium]|nr:hypothetical protein [Caulobacteraceae bacterium]